MPSPSFENVSSELEDDCEPVEHHFEWQVWLSTLKIFNTDPTVEVKIFSRARASQRRPKHFTLGFGSFAVTNFVSAI